MNKNVTLNSNMQECYMDVGSCAKFLCRSEKAIYDLVYRRKIPYRKLGKRLIFRQSDLESVLIQSKPIDK